MNTQELWRAALGELELLISKANFTTWFKNTTIISVIDGQVVVGVPNAFTKAWLENKYHNFILKALQGISELPIKTIIYQVSTNPQATIEVVAETIIPKPKEVENNNSSTNFGLNPRYTFENFIVGKNNELARAASLAVSQNPGQAYNPLFIYGGVGLGKTHLMQAIGHEILKQSPGKKVIYAPCEKFTNEFIQAISTGKIERFKSTYRSVDVLLIDDIQFLAGKEGTQEEFFHTFNTLHQNNKQIVISSDRPPKSIQALENRLVSRFEWGMIVDIASPDLETRLAILETKCRDKGFVLDKEVMVYLANAIQNNVRELEGALNRLMAIQQLKQQAPSLELVKELVIGLYPPNRPNLSITPKKIINTVSVYYNISVEELVGASRKQQLVIPRQISMYLMREVIKSSFPAIGQELGNRDHTTAMHACLKISQTLETNEKIKQDIHNLKQQIVSN